VQAGEVETARLRISLAYLLNTVPVEVLARMLVRPLLAAVGHLAEARGHRLLRQPVPLALATRVAAAAVVPQTERHLVLVPLVAVVLSSCDGMPRRLLQRSLLA